MTTSTSTPSKADAQQLLSLISPDVLHKTLRGFHQCPLTTTLLVTNQSSPIVSSSRISTLEQGTVKLSSALPLGVVPDGEPGRKLPPPPNSLSPKKTGMEPVTISESGFDPEPDKLSQESRAPSVSPVAKVDSHSKQHCQISSSHSNDSQQLEDPKHSSPAKTHQWDGSPGYEPSFVTGHDPIILTISTGGAKVHNPKDTHSQVDSAHGNKKGSSSSESGCETSVVDSTKKKKKKKKKHKTKSAGRSSAPRFISFSMHQPPSSMVKDYSWMLTDAADGTIPDQSNPKVIVDEPQEDDKVSQWDRVLGNPFTGPGDVVASLHDHSNPPPPSQPGDGDDGSGKDGGFCNMVQSLEGMILISEITEDMILIQKFCLMTTLQNLREAIQHLMFQSTLKVCFYLNQELQVSLPVGTFILA